MATHSGVLAWMKQYNNLMHIFELFCRNWDPHIAGVWWLRVDHKDIDLRLLRTTKLMIQISETTSGYLITNQSEESPWAATSFSNVVFKNPPLESHLWYPVIWVWGVCSLYLAPYNKHRTPSPQPSVSRLTLLPIRLADPSFIR